MDSYVQVNLDKYLHQLIIIDTKYTNKKVYYYGNMLQNTEPYAYSATKVFISTLYIVLCLISRKDLTSVLEVQFEEIHFNLQNDYF